jgi:hypothetical protein
MARARIQIAPHLNQAELVQNYEECQDSKAKSYWQVILLLNQPSPCLSVEQVANTVGFSTDWVRKLVHRYNRLGPLGLTDRYQTLRRNMHVAGQTNSSEQKIDQ